MTERENLTNASALALRRREYRDEQQRAYAIHSFKSQGHTGIRELYLREEPALFSAIRAGDRGQAREILNRVLVAIHHHAGSRLDLIKSFFLELVVSMCQTAVESGGDPEQLLGANFASMVDLAKSNTEEELSSWLVATLEHLMDTIQATRRRDAGTQLFDAIAYMERHCCERISRDDVARAAGFSPSHFSSLIRRESGSTFTDLLNRMRVDRAAELLSRTDRPLSLIALETGFADQSYFTKVFKRYRKVAPLQYRKKVVSG
jgi:YesN/AraC family two-component response regulator